MFFLTLCAVMMFTLAQPALAAESAEATGKVIHVAKNGSDSNAGTEAAPYLTINRAAQEAEPGDTVVVHAGLYRETVKPARGGSDEAGRITYTNAGDGEVVVKGSEEIDAWTQHGGDVWRVTLPNSYFGDYNPYSTRHPQGGGGDFFPIYTAGDVYLNEQAYYQKGSLANVTSAVNTWYAEVSTDSTTIYANFDGANPNDQLAEINVRRQIFAPDVWGLGYITVDGFTIKHAANTYSDFPGSPSRRQAGAISVNGGLKWIIENNIIINARTIAIDIGLGNDEWAGNRPGVARTDFRETDKYGSHIVRNNYIGKSGQSGVAGVFSWNSDIMYNMIEDTNYRGEFSGAETAPIKVHYMNEGLIKGNYIKNSKGGNSAGIWTDWGNQNVRVTGNIVMNTPWGYYAEAVHGPILVDNNVFIGNNDIRMLDATGVVYANNLFIDNGNINVDGGGRENYYFEPGTMNETNAMNTVQKFHWYNNLVRGSALPNDATNKTHVKEDNFTNVVSDVTYTSTNREMSLSFNLDVSSIEGLDLVTQERVGIIPNANESIAADVDTDFFGNAFTPGDVMAGPFADAQNGANTFVLWPPAGQTVPTPPAPPTNVPVNLSLNPNATATASYGDGTMTADKAIDGNGSSRWSSDHSNDNNAWIQVDLGDSYNVSRAVLSWEAASAREFKLQISNDGEEWEDVYYTASGGGGNESITVRKETHYLRMQGIAPNTAYGYSLYEFEVYGTAIEPEIPVNVALNKAPSAYTASSQSNDGSGEENSQPDRDRSAFRAFDGNVGTRWGSNGGNDNWLQVDLGSQHIINSIVLVWESAYASSYKLQVSDDGNEWQDIYSHEDATPAGGHTDEIVLEQPAEGRYVRMQGVEAKTEWGLSLYEFEVYGKVKPADTAPQWPVTATLALANVTASSASVQWPAAVDNGSVAGYKVYLGAALLESLGADARGYELSELAAGKTYTVKVTPVDDSGNEGEGLTRTFTTPGNPATKALSTTYPRSYDDWEEGLLAGDGTQGIIVFGNPLEETVVFNHREFFLARTEARPHRTFNDVSEENIKEIRDLLIAGDYQEANQLAADVQGYQGGGEGSKHPGYKMTMTMPGNGEIHNYVRSTDYSAGVVSVNWSDDKGDWERTSFVSRPDGVTVQYLPAPTGETLDVKLELGIDPGMNLLNKGLTFENNSNVDFLNLRVKYPNGRYNAGYEGVTRVVTDGDKAMDGDAVSVTGATYVLLLSLSERYDGTYEGGVIAEEEWNQELLQDELSGMTDDYADLLGRHVAAHSEIFDRVSIDYGASDADRSKSNEELLAMQKASTTPIPALFERMFYSGRYHLLGSGSETAPPDLLGNWTGDSNVGWDGYYHLDANLNLQISSGNIGNMPEVMEGYFYINHQWQEDFRTNAQKLLGTRGMLTGGNTPNGEGLISNINFEYPYQYVTGGESWLLYPIWEHYLVTGDTDFLEEQYYPLIRDMGDFYEDFLVEKDANGDYIFAGSISPENRPAGGVPLSVNSVYDIAGARFALETLIETSTLLGKDAEQIPVWQELLDNLPPYLINDDGALAEWAWPDLMNKNSYQHRHSSHMMPIWPYREVTPEKDRALYEAAKVSLQRKDGGSYENAGHGLLHGALAAANLNNADSVNAKLLRFAKDDFYYASMATSHYNNHGVFATDVVNSVPSIMMEMLAASDRGTLELLPALPKSLRSGSIEGMLGRGQVKIDRLSWDMDALTVEVELTSAIDQNLTLIQRAGIESIQSDDVQLAGSPLGGIARIVPLKAGETATIAMTIKDASRINLALDKDAEASSESNDQQGADKAFDGDPATRWGAGEDADNWLQVDLGDIYDLNEVTLQWETSYAKAYKLQASLDGQVWKDIYTQLNSQGGTEKIPVDALGRYVRMQGIEKSGQWGYSLYEMEVYGQEAPNLALGKPSLAMSASNPQQTAAAAFDGEMSTRWGASESADNWIQVDLEALYDVFRVVIEWEDSYAKGYKLQTSPDGEAWTDVFTEPNSNGGTDIIDLNETTKFVRMQGVEKSGQWGYSIYEMKVYGTPHVEGGENGPTAAEAAAAITALTAPAQDATTFALPTVPEGFGIAIKSSDKPGVIGLDGRLTPPASATEVTLVLTVTKTSDGSTADTAELKVTVPAASETGPTAASVAASIATLTAPVRDATTFALPTVPEGFGIAIKSSDKPGVIGLDGRVTPPASATEVTLVLTVTKTSDGSTADTAELKVTVPAKSVPDGGSGGDGNGNNGGNSGGNNGGTGQESSTTHTVTAAELADRAEDGSVVLNVAEEIRQIVLPEAAADLPADSKIVVRSGDYTLELPAAIVRQLLERADGANLTNGKLTVDIVPLTASDARSKLGSLPGQARTSIAGQAYSFRVSYVSGGENSDIIAQPIEPVVIRLKPDSAINPKLAGVYRLSENGEPEYIGGVYENGEWVFEANEFAEYAVLETVWQFADVPSGHWAENVIQELAAKHVVNGTGEAAFEPSRAVTRAEFVALLVRALKLTDSGDAEFADVAPGDWYAEAVSIAAKAGIATGKGGGVFDPDSQITREEMVTMLIRAYEAANGAGIADADGVAFGDADEASAWAAEFIRKAAALGLVRGRGAGLFDPQGIATRAESAQIIYNLLNS